MESDNSELANEIARMQKQFLDAHVPMTERLETLVERRQRVFEKWDAVQQQSSSLASLISETKNEMLFAITQYRQSLARRNTAVAPLIETTSRRRALKSRRQHENLKRLRDILETDLNEDLPKRKELLDRYETSIRRLEALAEGSGQE